VTKSIPFTQQAVRRAIAAARKEGLHVLAIRPDGTVLVGKEPLAATNLVPTAPLNEDEAERAIWENVKT
jgi:biotin operon repressor